MSRALRLTAATALAGAAFLGTSATAAPPDPGDLVPEVYLFCTVHFRQVPIFTDDVPVQPVVPYFVC